MSDELTRRLVRQNAQEHERLFSAVRKVERGLDRTPDAVSRGRARDLLVRLPKLLEEHFQLEEDGGLFDDVCVLNPGIEARVRELACEHVALLARIRGITSPIEAGAALTESMAHSVRAFVADLRRHECQENRLFQAVVYEELGGEG